VQNADIVQSTMLCKPIPGMFSMMNDRLHYRPNCTVKCSPFLSLKYETFHFFYRAMHCIEIACRLSVCAFVYNVRGSGSHKLEILETYCNGQLAEHLRSS